MAKVITWWSWSVLWLSLVITTLHVWQCESFACAMFPAATGQNRASVMMMRAQKLSTASKPANHERPLSQAFKMRLGFRKKERLQKLLSQAGVCSRRGAEQMLVDGRVTVNGEMANSLGSKAASTDVIKVDGTRVFVRPEDEVVWISYHKPTGVVCSMEDERQKFTIAAAIPRAKELRLLPVGRLDKDSTGLLLLTNDNTWIHTLTHPAFGNRKRYHVTVSNGCPTEASIAPLRRGLKVPAEKQAYRPVEIELLDYDDETAKIDILLSEGRNRQIRRMFEHIGHPVVRLKRIGFGPIKLGKLSRGDWRFLNDVEVAKLKQGVRAKLKDVAQHPMSRPAKRPHQVNGSHSNLESKSVARTSHLQSPRSTMRSRVGAQLPNKTTHRRNGAKSSVNKRRISPSKQN